MSRDRTFAKAVALRHVELTSSLWRFGARIGDSRVRAGPTPRHYTRGKAIVTNIECPSVVSRVVVHARGALITREVTLPSELPEGSVDVVVSGVTIQAVSGSVRATLEESERTVSAVHTAVVLPKGPVRIGPTVERVRDIKARMARLSEELRVLLERRQRLCHVVLEPRLRAHDRPQQRPRDSLDERFLDALEMSALIRDKTEALDQRCAKLELELREQKRQLDVAALEDREVSSADRAGESRPRRSITTRLRGEGRTGRLLLTYAVDAARWWPTYTLRVDESLEAAEEVSRSRATWTFEAIVAQRTGEDWSGVELSLSSADLVFDAQLPELRSLRFGRAQPKARPFRPPPVGVDDMLASYRAFRGVEAPKSQILMDGKPRLKSDDAFGGAPTDEVELAPPAKPSPVVSAPAPAMAAPQAHPAAPPQGAVPASIGGFAPLAKLEQQEKRRSFRASAVMDVVSEMPAPEPEPLEVTPSARWSHHDALVLAGADSPRSGRLEVRVEDEGARDIQSSVQVVAAAGRELMDPLETRGMFDHRYDARSRADVPSDGHVHRLTVAESPCLMKVKWRSVPSETEEVFREAQVINPFEWGLLGGPVDVYLNGSLLASTKIDRIDRGGMFSCGMGVDDRVKVARNVRATEESHGLLGGSIAVTHEVGIELASTVPSPITVTVLERVPVTDDKAIEVKTVHANPIPNPYDQADRGAPVRGGYVFTVKVSPEAKSSLQVVYRLVFAQKLDIVGGSRRG